ncbi:hypothetical protein OIU84_003010 [Salix udensis]|uniref:DUF3700 domain-containing protein n=1 Tax=Salix udensis TaxID=889485 RepID=A0AAD6K5W4_9ROSI|nr:hypothetical protein OIU84_003010 [Salix udensis]
MLAIFHKAFAHPPEELNSPASQKGTRQPKLPDETLKEFLSHHPSKDFLHKLWRSCSACLCSPGQPFLAAAKVVLWF